MLGFSQNQTLHATSERTLLERAFVNALASLRRSQGGYLAELGEYNGELAGEVEDIKVRLQGRLPAILVTTGRISYESVSVTRRTLKGSLEVEVVALSNHLRSREARTQGDERGALVATSDPGVYKVLADARRLLYARDLGITGVGLPDLLVEEPGIRVADLTAFTARYQVGLRFDQLPLVDPLSFEVIEHHHNVEDGATANPVLTGEAT